MEFIIIIVVVFIIYKLINSKKSSSNSSPSTNLSTPPEQIELMKSFYYRNNQLPIKDCQSYYKTLRECYEKYGNTMFELNVMKSFLHGYNLDNHMGITIDDIQKDLEKIARGEPDSNLSSPSADSLMSLLESLDRHKNIMEITDLDSYYKALREYYAKYGNNMLDLEVIMRLLRTYRLDNILNKNASDIQKDIETIANDEALPGEKLPLYKTKRWKEIKNDFPDIYDAESYLDTLEYFYLEYYNYMFDKDVINEFIRMYQLDTKFNISYRDVIKDLHKMDKQLKAEIHEEYIKQHRYLTWGAMERDNKIITDYQSYIEVLKQYYLEYGQNINTVDFVNCYKLKSRFNINFMDVNKDLDELEKTGNITPKQTPREQTQSVNITPSVETQHTQNKMVSNASMCNINDYNSYMEVLKWYYSQYGDDMFLPSKLKKFINDYQLDSRFNIKTDDVSEDLRAIRTGKPVQTQSTQVQNINAIQPEEDDHDYLEKRDVDKDFGKKVDGHEAFYFYVTNMSDTELINTINNQYKNIKGSWTLVPRMGEYGSVEFAVVLLLWKYAVNNFSKNPESYASLQIMLGDVICCAFFGMSAGEWSDKVDPIINAHTDIVSYEEFGNVYNYLRNNHIDKIHSLEFNNGNMQDEVYKQFYAKFIEIYNSTDDFSEMLDFYTSKGLKIKDDIHFNIANSKNDNLKNLLVREWKSDRGYFEEDGDIQQLPPLLTDKFYISSYRCPICGRHVYKTVFPIGGEFPIRTTNGYISMKRIFTCKTCLRFFTPLPGHKLSYGQYYFLRLETLDEYKMLLETYDEHGTTDGRPDA